MSVYVGKDVGITVQIPVEDEPHIISASSPYQITVDNIPISDRDQDGVPNEIVHVTVKDTQGNAITPVSVNDTTGLITFGSGDAGKDILITYRYDSSPSLAQEFTIEPRQLVEGTDALGSDVIQQWAILLKEYTGSIREVFKPGSFDQIARFATMNRFTETFENNNLWEVISGTWVIENGKYTGYKTDGNALSLHKYLSLKDFSTSFSIRHSGGIYDVALMFRRIDSQNYLYFGINHNDDYIRLRKIVSGVGYDIATYATTIDPNTYYTLKLVVNGSKFKGFLGDDIIFIATDSSITSPGRIGCWTNGPYSQIWIDDLKVVSPPLIGSEYGIIAKWDRGGSVVRVGLDKVVFPEGSIPSPKNAPVFIITPFRAMTAKTIA